MYRENSNQKRIRVEILMSGKIDLKTKVVSRGKEEDFIIIIKSIIHRDTTIINIYTSKNSPPPYA